MIGAVIAWLTQLGLSRTAARVVFWAAAFALVAGTTALLIHRHDAGIIADHDAATAAQVAIGARAADEVMRNYTDAQRAAQEADRREFDNASLNLPREGLGRRQRLDLCIELRDAGEDIDLIPACVDLRTGAKAGTLGRHPEQ